MGYEDSKGGAGADIPPFLLLDLRKLDPDQVGRITGLAAELEVEACTVSPNLARAVGELMLPIGETVDPRDLATEEEWKAFVAPDGDYRGVREAVGIWNRLVGDWQRANREIERSRGYQAMPTEDAAQLLRTSDVLRARASLFVRVRLPKEDVIRLNLRAINGLLEPVRHLDYREAAATLNFSLIGYRRLEILDKFVLERYKELPE